MNAYNVEFDRMMGARPVFRVEARTDRASRLLETIDGRRRRRQKHIHTCWLGVMKAGMFVSLYDDGWDATNGRLFHPGV